MLLVTGLVTAVQQITPEMKSKTVYNDSVIVGNTETVRQAMVLPVCLELCYSTVYL